MNNWIISYPRSGSTWLRYCLEYLSKKPSVGYRHGTVKTIDDPIGFFVKIGVCLEEPPIVTKRHQMVSATKDDNVLLVLRDPSEVLIRHFKTVPEGKKQKFGIRSTFQKQVNWYDDILTAFHNSDSNKMVVYYEDLISNQHVKSALNDVLTHYEITSVVDLDDFCRDIVTHRKTALQVYGYQFTSLSKGKVSNYAKGANSVLLEMIDNYLQSKRNSELEPYLKRYL